MKHEFAFEGFVKEIDLLAHNSPMTQQLARLIQAVDFTQLIRHEPRALKPHLKTPVVAATDPWAEVEYQSLYIRGGDRNNRIVLQQPTSRDPMVGVMVLKAARLSGDSGMVFCGTPEALTRFAEKLGEYEKRGQDLDEKELLECLIEAAHADGLKVVFSRISPEHGGDEIDYDDED